MALQSSGPISASQIRNEFAGVIQVSFSKYFRHAEPTDGLEVFSGTYTSANNSGVPTSGAIKFSDFYSKYWEVMFKVGSVNVIEDANTSTLFGNYWGTNVPKRLKNNGTIGATSTGNAALTVSASVSGSIVIVNNGNIQGAGGAAGAIGADGGNGGNAIFLSSSCSITNTGTIYAGGGFGGGKSQLGVQTDKKVKRIGCSNFKSLVEENKLLIQDADVISEITTFIEVKGSYSADDGYHDDLVMPLVLFSWLTTNPYFKDLNDVNMRSIMYEQRIQSIESELTPFGFFNDGNDAQEQVLANF